MKNIGKKETWLIGIMIAAIMIGVIEMNISKKKTNEVGFVTSAHYFADEWPINFWNAEWDNLEEDLKQIRADGFNTVILVVPWREFQPQMDPITYDQTCLIRLKEIIKAAGKQNLNVQIRLGYINDFGGENNSTDRFYDIIR